MKKRLAAGLAGLPLVLSGCGSDGAGAGGKSEPAEAAAGSASTAESAYLKQVHADALGSGIPDATALEVGHQVCESLDEPGVGVGETMVRGGVPQTHLFMVEAAVKSLCPEHMDKWDAAMAAKDAAENDQ